MAWGLNASGQCNVPAGLNNVAAVRAGGNNSFAIKADGTMIAWGINDSGQTNVPPGLANVLDCGSGNAFGIALLGSLDRPAVLENPSNSTNAIGSTVTFSVLARSSAPLSYQWRFASVDIPGATNSSLQITNIAPANEGLYSVMVSTAAGSCESVPAYLHVIPAPFLPFPSGTPGRVIAWGRNIYGETNVPAGLTNAVALATGSGSLDTFAFRLDGSITRWGGGVGLPAQLTNLVSVFGAPNYGFGLNANGTVETWGSPAYTALQSGITGVQAIGAGAVKLVLYTNGVVQPVDNGTLLNGTSNAVAIAVGGGHALALLNDGTIRLDKWNYPYSEQTAPPANWSNVVAVAAGLHHSLVLQADGTVAAWGRNSESQCSVPPGLSNVIAIAAAGNHSLALKSDRTVVTWGDSAYGLNQPPGGLTNVVGITCGFFHSTVIQAGPVFTVLPTNIVSGIGSNVTFQAAAAAYGPVSFQWFLNETAIPGATNSQLTLTNVQAQDTGAYLMRAEADGFAVQAVARLSLGAAISVLQKPSTLWVMPADTAVFAVSASNSALLFYQWSHGTQLLPGATNSVLTITNVQSNQAGNYSVSIYNNLGMTTNVSANLIVLATQPMGKVVSWGSNTNVPAWLSGVIEIAAGDNHSLALRADGTVVSWGDNAYGQTNVPAGLRDVVAIAGGGRHSLALKQDGTIIGWGHNFNGQASPPGVSGVRSVAGGNSFSAGVDQDGGIFAWGNSYGGALSVPIGLANGMRVAAGYAHGLALKSDGTVVGWGDDTYGQSSAASNFTDVAAIAAGHYGSMVLRSNGTVAAFGFNFAGQTNVPAGLSNVTAIAANYGRCLVAQSNGLVTGWGLNDQGQGQSPVGLSNAVKVAAGTYHTLALLETGCYIWKPPTHMTVLAGSNVLLQVGATGVPPLTYQWRFNGMDIPLATNAVLSLPNVQFTNGGSYSVLVTSSRGSETTAPAMLAVLSPPIFTVHPISQIVSNGTTVLLSVTVTGSPPVSLRWQRNGSNLANATASTLTLSNVTLGNAGDYQVVATNLYGRTTSAVALLTVNVSPSILLPPTNQMVLLGSNVLFAVNASGSLPLAYQWLKAGAPIAGATNASLSIIGVQNSDAGSYSVQVTNTFGTATTSPALLTVLPIAPTIITQPATVSARFGDTVAFAVGATGASPLSYQWRFAGTIIPGGTAASLTISDVNLANEGNYQVLVSNADGAVLSVPANLTLRLPPNVVAWGSNQLGQINVPDDLTNATAIAAGEFHNLAVREDGTVMAWGNNGYGQSSVPGGLSNVVAVAAGERQSLALLASGVIVGWGATNSYGEATPPANTTNIMRIEGGSLHSLAVLSNGTAVGWGYNAYGQATPPAGLSNVIAVTAGFEHSLALHSNGTVTGWGYYYGEPNGLSNVVAIASASYQFMALLSDGRVASWGPGNSGQLKFAGPTNAIAISGGGGSASHFLAILTNGQPYIWGTNPAGIYTPPSTLANVAGIASGFSHNLALVRAPLIILNPASQTVNEGETVVLRVRTARTDGAQLQWRKNGLPISGATNGDLVLGPVQFNDSGTYTASVSNRFGMATSTPAQLTVVPRLPVITGHPSTSAVTEGSDAAFSVTATGMGVLSFQWLFNNTVIPGANSSILVVSNVSAAKCGQYAVVVANNQGFTLSSNAALTFASGELILDNPQASVTGLWTASLATNRYGTNSLFAAQGFGDASARFSQTVPKIGTYQIYAWHSAVPNRSTSVPFHIAHAGGETLVNVNQALSAGVWRSIGAFPFAPTTTASITVSDGFPDAGKVAVADAVKFVYVPSPPTILVQPQNQVGILGSNVIFSVTASGAGPLAYQWRKNGVNLLQATNDSTLLMGIQTWDTGTYAVLVTGPDGVTVSQSATLEVAATPLNTRVSAQALVLEWIGAGILQTSTNVTGPYIDLPAAQSPYTNSQFMDQQRFFRLRSGTSVPSVTIQADGALALTWPHSGMLETATMVGGPYVDIPWALSPFTNNLPATPERYFRVRY